MKKIMIAALLCLVTSTAYADLNDEVHIHSVEAKQLRQSGSRLIYSVKVDVENKGEVGKVFVNVVGLDANGFEIANTPLNGMVGAGETRGLTGMTLVNPQNGQVVKWEAKSFFKTK